MCPTSSIVLHLLKILVFGDHNMWVTVTAARRILAFEMEVTTCRYEEELQMYLISSRGQPTMGGTLFWRLGEKLKTS
jgi:hypothetical protein